MNKLKWDSLSVVIVCIWVCAMAVVVGYHIGSQDNFKYPEPWKSFVGASANVKSNATGAPVAKETPKVDQQDIWRSGTASWYDTGSRTANGERFIPEGMTCAHKTLKFNTILEVRYEGKTVEVRVNDRGPFIRGRELDLALGAFEKLAPLGAGVIEVEWRVVE